MSYVSNHVVSTTVNIARHALGLMVARSHFDARVSGEFEVHIHSCCCSVRLRVRLITSPWYQHDICIEPCSKWEVGAFD